MIKEILRILEDDARTTTKRISTMTGTPTAEVARLILYWKRLIFESNLH